MPPKLNILLAARDDLASLADHLLETASDRTTRQFEAAFLRTCESIQQFPERGKEHRSLSATSRGLRWVPVSGFRRVLVFYKCRTGSISVVRVIHGSRDIASLL